MKDWKQRERAPELLSKEVGYVRKPHGGRLRVALAFPNTYFVGMSNLGFQTGYRPFNELEGVVWGRGFLPGRAGPGGPNGLRPAAPYRRVRHTGTRLRRAGLLRLLRMGLHQRGLHAAPGGS